IALMLMLTAVLLVSGTPIGVLAPGLGIMAAVGTFAIWLEPYRRARFFAFLHPTQDPLGIGYQTMQGLISLGSGGVSGVGIGNGIGRLFYLPEAPTDMI